jgi:hypothetical protein
VRFVRFVFFVVLKKSNQCKAIRHGLLNFENGFVLVSHCICGKKAVYGDIQEKIVCNPSHPRGEKP